MRSRGDGKNSKRRGATIARATLGLLCWALLGPAQTRAQSITVGDATGRTKTGIDVLEEQNFAPLKGKRIGLITNQTGVDAQGRRTIDVLAQARDVKLAVLFSPEHGMLGDIDAKVGDSTDAATGLHVYSLYGETRRPTADMLKGLDALVFDIQDVGVRFYTYTTTMAYGMEEAAKQHVAFYVLDRPDPLDGLTIEGPMLDRDRTSFTGYFPMPIRYAMTMGELARMFNAENAIGVELHVIAMENWRRDEPYEQTGLPWVPPSPNLRTMNEVRLYPGIELLQAGGVSVGRGTAGPFEMIGAPWIDGEELAPALQKRHIDGVQFTSTEFTPTANPYGGQKCGGVKIEITDPRKLNSVRMGLEIAQVLRRGYPNRFKMDQMGGLVGSRYTMIKLQRGQPPAQIEANWAEALDDFWMMRRKYLLYHTDEQ